MAEADGAGNITKEYAYFAGQPLAQMVGDDIYYYHNSHLGTPEVMTDASQNIVWQASHTPFGRADISVETITNNIRFPGQYYDEESGLHYNYFRDYDPEIGRYIQSDPIGLAGGVNTYGYVLQNPINGTDRFGLFTTLTLCGRNPAACQAAGMGAIGGGAIGAGVNAVSQYMDCGDIDWNEVGYAGLEGMFFGATLALVEFRVAGAILGRLGSNGLTASRASGLVSAAAQRGTLRGAMGTPAGEVAHHLIPVQALAAVPLAMARAIQGGFRFNGANNGHNLVSGVTHIGGHPGYNQAVISQLRNISPNLSNRQIAREVQNIADTIGDSIRNGSWGPWY